MIDAALGGRVVLAVFAHPDDESLACGGTLARLADAGFRVVVMTASRGERGSPAGPARDEALGRERALEIRHAATALGVAEVIIGDYPDGNLRWSHISALHADLVTFMRRRAPAAVITFDDDGLYWHPDHVAIHERTTTVVASIGQEAPPLYYVTMAQGVMTEIVAEARRRGWTAPLSGFWSLEPDAFGKAAQPPTITVDVGAWVPRKLAALLCHRSQMVDGHPFTQLDAAAARRLLGAEYFRRADIPANGEPVLERL